jgi:hypothetical protein
MGWLPTGQIRRMRCTSQAHSASSDGELEQRWGLSFPAASVAAC